MTSVVNAPQTVDELVSRIADIGGRPSPCPNWSKGGGFPKGEVATYEPLPLTSDLGKPERWCDGLAHSWPVWSADGERPGRVVAVLEDSPRNDVRVPIPARAGNDQRHGRFALSDSWPLAVLPVLARIDRIRARTGRTAVLTVVRCERRSAAVEHDRQDGQREHGHEDQRGGVAPRSRVAAASFISSSFVTSAPP